MRLAPGVHALPSRPLPFANPQGYVYWGDFTITLNAMRSNGDRPCLDVDITEGGRLGNKVQVWDCNNSPQQDWSVFEISPGSHVFELVNVKYWMCLDADSNMLPRNGTRVQLWGCNGEPQQHWRMPLWQGNAPWIPWHQLLVDPYPGTVLDADNRFGLANGSSVQVWQGLGGQNQTWHFWPYG